MIASYAENEFPPITKTQTGSESGQEGFSPGALDRVLPRPRSGRMPLAVGGALRGAHGRRATQHDLAASAAGARKHLVAIAWRYQSEQFITSASLVVHLPLTRQSSCGRLLPWAPRSAPPTAKRIRPLRGHTLHHDRVDPDARNLCASVVNSRCAKIAVFNPTWNTIRLRSRDFFSPGGTVNRRLSKT